MSGAQPANTSIAPHLITIGTFIQVITTALVAARIGTRLRSKKRLYSYDWAILVAQALAIPSFLFSIAATNHGYGRFSRYVPFRSTIKAMRYIFIAQVIFYWSVTMVKISVALLLISLKQYSRPWRIFLYLTIGVLTSSLVLVTLMQFAACSIIASYWDPRLRAKAVCWPVEAISGVVITFSAVHVAADVIYTFMPLTFIVRLNQPLYQRIIIGVLMSLGLFASIAAIFRTLGSITRTQDYLRRNAETTMLAVIESGLGIIAATLPTLKNFFESCLRTFKMSLREETAEQNIRAKLFKAGLLDEMYEKEKKQWGGDIEKRAVDKSRIRLVGGNGG